MLSIRRTYYWLFLYFLLIQVPALSLVKFADELGVLLFLIVMLLDILLNGSIKRYKGIFAVGGVMSFYALYSIVALNFNTTKAILVDFVIQLKPYIPFFFTYALAPSFTRAEKNVIKKVCVAISVLVTTFGIISFFNSLIFRLIFEHISEVGIITTLVGAIYVYVSVREDDGRLSKKDLLIVTLMFIGGLTCTRSKFYGEFIFALYLLYLYKPNAIKRINWKQMLIFGVVFLVILWAAWTKINYYFLGGATFEFDEETAAYFARPALYAGMALILIDFPLLGSGLGSYATHASSPHVSYSEVYRTYDLDKVWGLSYDMPDFITDAFFPQLAQFGLVGITLFILLFVWIYKRARIVLHKDGKFVYAAAMITFVTIFIESTTGSAFMKGGVGSLEMCLLGLIIAQYKHIDLKELKKMEEELKNENINK